MIIHFMGFFPRIFFLSVAIRLDMKILALEAGFYPELTSARIAFEFSQEMARRGNDVTVITTYPRKYLTPTEITVPRLNFFYKEVIEGFEIYHVRPHLRLKNMLSRIKENLILPLTLLIMGIFKLKDADIIHCQSPPLLLSFTSCLMKLVSKKPLILRIQDIHPDGLVKINILTEGSIITKLLETIEKFVYLKADHITVISEGYKKNLINKGINIDKISIISNWVSINNLTKKPDIEKYKSENDLAGKFILTYAGSMSWPQDLDTIVEAAALLKDNSEIIFLLVGDGVKKELLINKTNDYKLDNIRFYPLQNRRDYFDLIYASDICFVSLMNSYLSPTLPSKIYEIMACETPIIANVPFESEVYNFITTSKVGLWVEPEKPRLLKKAIMRLYSNREYGIKLGKIGGKIVEEEFSVKNSINKYEVLMNKL